MASLTELTYSGALAASTLLYAVLDHETSAVSRSTSLVDLETAMTNKLNTLANQGTGFEVFRERSGTSGILKTLVGGANITLSSATSTVTITGAAGGAGGEANLGANLGTGIETFREKSSVTLNFRTLIGGTNITLSSATSTITIDSGAGAGEANTAANLGTGIEAFREKSGTALNFRTLTGGKDITVSSATSLITITNAASEKHFSATIGASNTWNNELIPIWQAPRGGSATIVEVLGTTSGTTAPTVSFNLQHRDWDAMQSAGIDVFAASQVATSAGEQFTGFARATVDPRAHLMFTTGSGAEAGSANYLQLTVYYTI